MLTDRSFKGLALFTALITIAMSFALAIATLQPGSRARAATLTSECTPPAIAARCVRGTGA